MATLLRPETQKALLGFQQRRTRLLLQQTGLKLFILLAGLFLIIALLDRAFFMPDGLRHAFSVVAYFVAFGLAGWQLLLFYWQRRDPLATAKQMEMVTPALRERLVAAMELAEKTPEGSEQFGQHLQDQVAAEMASLIPTEVLPTRLLSPWIKGSLAAVAVIVILSCIPFLKLPGFLARAALPFANIGRPSNIRIVMINPEQGDSKVPFASVTGISAHIQGSQPERVVLEIKGEDKPTARIEMASAVMEHYESSVQIEQSSLQYRIRAGDGITPWYVLDARPRPRIISCTKTITPPEYTKLPPVTVTEEQGDISALEGSKVSVVAESNQPLSAAVVQLIPPASSTADIVLNKADATKVPIELLVDGKVEAWQLNLTAAETGFSNDENTLARIETIADLPPVVAITKPSGQLEVRQEDRVTVESSASDDIGLVKLDVSYAVNGADWKNTAMNIKPGREAQAKTDLALNKISAVPGDVILVKTIATDVKGQQAESNTIRLYLVTDSPDLAQRQWANVQKQLAIKSQALREQARSFRKDAEQIRKSKDEESAKSAMASFKQELAAMEEQSKELWEQLKQAAAQAPNTLKQQEIKLAGEQMAALRNDHLTALHNEMEQAKSDDLDERRVKQSANQAAQSAETLAEALQAFATADMARLANESFLQLSPQQEKLANESIDANRNQERRPKWQEQQRAALDAAKNAQADLKALQDTAPHFKRGDIENQMRNLNAKLPGIENALDNAQQHQAPEFIYGQSHEMRNAIHQARDVTRGLAEEAFWKAAEMRERLQSRENTAMQSLEQARGELNRAAHEKNAEKQKEAVKQATHKLTAAANQLKAQSELQEQNIQDDSMTALDKNRLGRAVDELNNRLQADSSQETAKELSKDAQQLAQTARMLEADAHAQAARQALEETPLQDGTRQQLDSSMAALSELKPLADALQRAQADPMTADFSRQAASMSEWQRNEAQGRYQQELGFRQNGQTPPPVPQDQNRIMEANKQARQKLDETMQQFSDKLATARQQLESMTPSLSEMADHTSKKLKETQQKTQEAASQADSQYPEETASQAQSLMPEADKNAKALQDLQTALRQEAAHKDMSSELDRQMTRTADLALAQLRQQSPEISGDLQKAVESSDAAQQAQALQNASNSQQQTAATLQQLAQNLSKMEKGQMLEADVLAAQQAMEEALGIKQPLDETYEDVQNIADIMQKAQGDPQAALTALEKELQKNESMQLALSNLAAQTAQETLSKTQEQQAHEFGRVARHQQRLGMQEAAQQAEAASKNKDQSQATKAAESASTAAREKAASTEASSSFLQVAKGAMLAKALDQLDQSLNPQMGDQAQQAEQQNGQTQPGQPSPAEQANAQKQAAQQSLAQAAKNQNKSMAQSRAQNQTPGQQAPQNNQQMASQPQQPADGQPTPDASGNWAQTKANVLVPTLTVQPGGDWGNLPSRMAKDLTEASRQELAPEYRPAIESYYKAIAEKAKQ